MIEKIKKDLVFYISMVLCLIIAVWSVGFSGSFTVIANSTLSFLTHNFGWLYLLSVGLFVVFTFYMALGKFGHIRLGADDDRPEYSTLSWFAMLFGAGMGVGLVFYGIAEPVSHYMNPIPGVESMTREAADFAIKASFVHWGIHPWSCFAVVGLAIAYFQFRKKRPGLMSSVLDSFRGKNSALRTAFDVVAAFATVAGVVTSLGLGVMQINSGLNYLFGIPFSLIVQITIIVVIAFIFVGTAVSGIDKGIKMISDANLYIAIFVIVGSFLVGPKVEIINNTINGVGNYINTFVKDTLLITSYGDNSWTESWTIFYWAWWIAWAPFVGLFIARISKGRTIKEFCIGVVLAPALAGIVWFGIFGTLGIHAGVEGLLSTEALAGVAASPETGVFVVMEQYPFGKLLAIVTLVLLTTFFVTSANSGTYVLSQLTCKGSLTPDRKKMFIWGVLMTMLAIGLLMAGGLKPLQTISIAAAFPFVIIMVVTAVSMIKSLSDEVKAKEPV